MSLLIVPNLGSLKIKDILDSFKLGAYDDH
jgi:hypothetical protein